MFLAHLTHEAVQKIGGIGAVLAGLITSRYYKSTVKRTVLVGPLTDEDRKVIAAGRGDLNIRPAREMEDRTAAVGLAQIEKRYNVEIFYGKRRYSAGAAGLPSGAAKAAAAPKPAQPSATTVTPATAGHAAPAAAGPAGSGAAPAAVAAPTHSTSPGSAVDNEAEVLLIDVSKMPKLHVDAVKQQFQKELDLRFDNFKLTAEEDRYVRLAVPAYEALLTLRRSKDGPCVLVSHEWYGLPLAYWICGRRDPRFRTIFHAHEVAVVRPIIEKHPAHDVMFYNAMRTASEQGKSLPEVFGEQDSAFRPALVMRTHMLDRLFAVGDSIVEELRFLGPEYQEKDIDLVYNGILAPKILPEAKFESRQRLQEYARRLVGWRPHFVFTHVARPVVSKAFWRDLQVMAELDPKLEAAGEKAVLFILASATHPRTAAQVAKMEKHGWPLEHEKGEPDLVGPEVAIDKVVRAFNKKAKASHAIYVNQFGWEHGLCGTKMPKAMTFSDIRRGSDVEFGLSAYEPFGIAQIEPLPFGTICVLSRACGCCGFIERVDKNKELPTVLIRDYTARHATASLPKLMKMTAEQLAEDEQQIAAELAEELFKILPRSDKDIKKYLALGYRYARQMSWEVVARDYFLNGVRQMLTPGGVIPPPEG